MAPHMARCSKEVSQLDLRSLPPLPGAALLDLWSLLEAGYYTHVVMMPVSRLMDLILLPPSSHTSKVVPSGSMHMPYSEAGNTRQSDFLPTRHAE